MEYETNFLYNIVYDPIPSYSPLFENITYENDKCNFSKEKIKKIEKFIYEYIVNEETGKKLLKEDYNDFVRYYILLFREEIKKHLENIPKIIEDDKNIKDISRYNNFPRKKK